MRFGLLALMLLCAPSVPAYARTLSVEEILRRHEELDGKRVVASGWIVTCQMLGCILQPSPDGGHGISIGSSNRFDAAVRRHFPKAVEVLVEGVIQRECFDHSADTDRDPENEAICLDRSDELAHPRLIRVLSTRRVSQNEEN